MNQILQFLEVFFFDCTLCNNTANMSQKITSQKFQDTKIHFFWVCVVVSRNTSNAHRPGTSVNWSSSLFYILVDSVVTFIPVFQG